MLCVREAPPAWIATSDDGDMLSDVGEDAGPSGGGLGGTRADGWELL